MKLKKTGSEFSLSDDSGYRFDVITDFDPEYGWNASVSFSSHGYKIEHAALTTLLVSVRRFLEMAERDGFQCD